MGVCLCIFNERTLRKDFISSLMKKYVCRPPEGALVASTSIVQCMMQYISQFELRMGKTSPETIVFGVRKLPQLEVSDNITYMTLYISTVTHPLILYNYHFFLIKLLLSRYDQISFYAFIYGWKNVF
jgi:hypothetical protein